jgi:hypothetical protein
LFEYDFRLAFERIFCTNLEPLYVAKDLYVGLS